jgi:hypothetical protein
MFSFGLVLYVLITDSYTIRLLVMTTIGNPFGFYNNDSLGLLFSSFLIIFWHLFALIPGVLLYSIKTIIHNQTQLQTTLNNNR